MTLRYLASLVSRAQAVGDETDGTTSEAELSFLAGLAVSRQVTTIVEVGFNAGFSSFTFLAANPVARVTSFDLGRFTYTDAAKGHLDRCFPGRHELIIGDSRNTVPQFHVENPDVSIDLAFIDGGHSYDEAIGDLVNLHPLATPGAWVVIDDLTPWKPWGVGPTQAWREAQRDGCVVQRLLVQDGVIVSEPEPGNMRSRVWALGTYT